MGVIKTKGKAEHSYECDLMMVTICFQESGEEAASISKSVMENCEKFIDELLDFSKLTLKDIHIDEDDVSEHRYSNETANYAKRTICIKTSYDMKLVNLIRQHLNDGAYHYNILLQYDYSRANELHAEMVKEALLEAKHQAELIADSLGLEVDCLEKAEEQGAKYEVKYTSSGEGNLTIKGKAEGTTRVTASAGGSAAYVDVTVEGHFSPFSFLHGFISLNI